MTRFIKIVALGWCGFSWSSIALAQNTCGSATMQLQGYIAQVNQLAQNEYSSGIPSRCGYNQQCSYWWLGQLNQWYAMQSNQVNAWYMQIARTCSSSQSTQRIDRGQVDNGGITEIDEDAVEELDVDDEDKTVVLRIPDSPAGFRPRQRRR